MLQHQVRVGEKLTSLINLIFDCTHTHPIYYNKLSLMSFKEIFTKFRQETLCPDCLIYNYLHINVSFLRLFLRYPFFIL